VQATPGGASLALVPQAKRNLELARRMAESIAGADTGRGAGSGTREDTGPARDAQAHAEVLARVLLAQARISLNVDLDAALALKTLDRLDPLVATGFPAARAEDQQSLRTEALMLRADTLEWQGKYKEATALVTAELARPRPPQAQWSREQVLEVAKLHDLLAESIYYGGDPHGAEAPYQRQLVLLQDLLARHPDDIRVDQLTQRAAWCLGTTLMQNGRFASAEPILARAQRAMDELRRLDPEDANIARLHQVVLMAHAQSLGGVKRFDEAIPVLKQGVALRLAASTASPENFGLARDYAVSLNMLGEALDEAGRRVEACAQFGLAQQVVRKLKVSGKLTQLDIDYMQRLAAASIKRNCAPKR
jgi:tetratricopeptide (TPR) repeat protein